ncbi:hypothetical protein D3C77_745020 [compost metagenome]
MAVRQYVPVQGAAQRLRAMLAEPAAGDEALQGWGNRHEVSSGSFKGRAYHSARV